MLSMESAYEELFENVLCGIVQICLPLKENLEIYKINSKAKFFVESFGKEIGAQRMEISNYMDGDNRKYAHAIFSRLKEDGASQPFLLQTYNGVIEGFAEYIRIPNGQPVIQVFFLELGEEIAIRKREAAQKELLESVLQSVRCGVVRYGYSGEEESILLVNDMGWKMLGFESEQQCLEQGMGGFLGRVHPDDRRILLRAQYTLNQEMEKKQCEFRIQCKDEWQWLSAQLQCLRDTQGNRIVQMTLTDITAQKQLEQKQKAESSEIIHSLGTIYQDILYVDARQDTYRMIKREKKTVDVELSGGYSKDLEIVCQAAGVLEAEEVCRQLSLARFSAFFQTEGAFLEQDFQIRSAGEDNIYYHVEAVLSGGKDGLQHITIGLRDVTSQRQQELREHEALQTAYRAETLANRAKTEFLSRMSHDIRTPMNAIIGLSQLMRTELGDTKKVAEYLDQMDTASQLLLGLINDVLDVSRIESGQMKVSVQPFRMDELLNQINTLIQPQMKEHQHHYHTEISMETMEYIGDPLHLQQILTNLLSNAVKFTPDGGQIVLRIWNEHGKREIHFEVSDNGAGMSEEFKQRIFQPFEREAEAEHIQGSGLGMAIVASLVHLMNGWIEIQSSLGKGSTFHIMLPLRPAEKKIKKESKEEKIQESIPNLHGKRILVVDDHGVNRMIACKLLENMGAEVEEAADGLLALDKFQNSPFNWFDMILMDVRMPNMGGYEATRKIRDLERTDAVHVPIIAMTANAFAEDIYAAKQAGMNDHLAKPVQMTALYHTLQKWLGISEGNQEENK